MSKRGSILWLVLMGVSITAAPSAAEVSFQGLGGLSGGGGFLSSAVDVSANGLVVAGTAEGTSGYEAFRWENDVMMGLGDLEGGGFGSWAQGVSADGSIVVGHGESKLGDWPEEAFRWENGVMTGLGDLPVGDFYSHAYDVSADGSVVVGYSCVNIIPGSFLVELEAFRWTESEGMQGLGDLPGASCFSVAEAVSADGSIVVGRGSSALGDEAFIWDTDNGMRSLQDVLENVFQLDLTGWTLNSANAISADGLTIVGYGTNPVGDAEAWIATIPEPTTLILFALGGLMLRRKRRAT